MNWQISLYRNLEEEKEFSFSYVDLEIADGIATVTINRPEAMNALNETVVNQLGDALDKANSDKSVRTIVLDGAGKAFVAGAGVKFLSINPCRFLPDIYDFTANGHVVKISLNPQARPQLH